MKVVIKVTRLSENHEYAMKFAHAVACLFHDAHSIAIVHGPHGGGAGDDLGANGKDQSAILSGAGIGEVETENRSLVAILARVGMSALGICGSDGGMCEIRKVHSGSSRELLELGRMNSRWIEVICANRGLPVISNVAVAAWGEHCLLDADKLASDCAKAWRADALIYLTTVGGVRSADGTTMRWLDIGYLETLTTKAAVTQDMLGKLKACRQAIESGVGRVRILPLSHVDCLPFFFSSRIDVGTEVINLRGGSENVQSDDAAWRAQAVRSTI
jgi:acetylglutamate kinase